MSVGLELLLAQSTSPPWAIVLPFALHYLRPDID
jgi:hypothetical protein